MSSKITWFLSKAECFSPVSESKSNGYFFFWHAHTSTKIDRIPSWWDKWPQGPSLCQRKILVKSSWSYPAGSLTENVVGWKRSGGPRLGNARNGSEPFLRFGPCARKSLPVGGGRYATNYFGPGHRPAKNNSALECLEYRASLKHCICPI